MSDDLIIALLSGAGLVLLAAFALARLLEEDTD